MTRHRKFFAPFAVAAALVALATLAKPAEAQAPTTPPPPDVAVIHVETGNGQQPAVSINGRAPHVLPSLAEWDASGQTPAQMVADTGPPPSRAAAMAARSSNFSCRPAPAPRS